MADAWLLNSIQVMAPTTRASGKQPAKSPHSVVQSSSQPPSTSSLVDTSSKAILPPTLEETLLAQGFSEDAVNALLKSKDIKRARSTSSLSSLPSEPVRPSKKKMVVLSSDHEEDSRSRSPSIDLPSMRSSPKPDKPGPSLLSSPTERARPVKHALIERLDQATNNTKPIAAKHTAESVIEVSDSADDSAAEDVPSTSQAVVDEEEDETLAENIRVMKEAVLDSSPNVNLPPCVFHGYLSAYGTPAVRLLEFSFFFGNHLHESAARTMVQLLLSTGYEDIVPLIRIPYTAFTKHKPTSTSNSKYTVRHMIFKTAPANVNSSTPYAVNLMPGIVTSSFLSTNKTLGFKDYRGIAIYPFREIADIVSAMVAKTLGIPDGKVQGPVDSVLDDNHDVFYVFVTRDVVASQPSSPNKASGSKKRSIFDKLTTTSTLPSSTREPSLLIDAKIPIFDCTNGSFNAQNVDHWAQIKSGSWKRFALNSDGELPQDCAVVVGHTVTYLTFSTTTPPRVKYNIQFVMVFDVLN